MKKTNKLVTISNIASFVIIVALVVMQFMPFWYTVNGVHMTPAEYEEYLASEAYVYTGEKIILEEETAPEATEAATAGEKKASEEGYYVLKCYACDTEQNIYPSSVKFCGVKNLAHTSDKCRGCKSDEAGYAVIGEVQGDQIIEWEDRVSRASIAQRVWFILEGAPALMLHVWTLLLGAVCFYFCILRPSKTISFLPVGAIAVINTLGYLKPEAMTGSLWIVHMVLSCLLFVPALILFIFWLLDVVRWLVVKDR